MNKDTLVTTVGRDPKTQDGVVNPPVFHASTVLATDMADLHARDKTPFDGTRYGRRGTKTHQALEVAMATLEGGHRAIAMPSGLAAITGTLMAFLKSGDHLLMTDSAYAPSRFFCDKILKDLGVTTTYYDPMIGAGIKELMTDATKLVFCESPGSLTFEVQDLPAIAEAAHAGGAKVAIDNTWATPYYFKALDYGADLSINAATKYIVGHSDAMLGVITGKTEADWLAVRRATALMGYAVGPDDVYLGLRGLRTLAARLDRHQASALRVAEWLKGRDEVDLVLHPALPECPGHDIWKRDFSGASGLFSFVLKPEHSGAEAVAALVDGLEHFGLGYSWGGFESLIIPANPAGVRTATKWGHAGYTLRLHIGLEDVDDLLDDLAAGFSRLIKA